MRISDWSSDVCSSDLAFLGVADGFDFEVSFSDEGAGLTILNDAGAGNAMIFRGGTGDDAFDGGIGNDRVDGGGGQDSLTGGVGADGFVLRAADAARSEEHTSELQSLMRISYAVFCLNKKQTQRRKSNY